MILLRHGQSEFNLHFTRTRRDPGIVDPALTPLGHEQAAAAAEALAGGAASDAPITRIICSPYTRALQTAEPVAKRLGVPVYVNPIVRERYAFTCDVGRPITELAMTWPDRDFAGIEEIWWPAAEEQAGSVIARAALFRAEIAALPDWANTLVISHWGFILCMTGTSVMNGQWLRCDPTAAPPPEIVWKV